MSLSRGIVRSFCRSRDHLGCPLKTGLRPQPISKRHIFSSIRIKRAVVTSLESERLTQDRPFDQVDASQNAFQSTSHPDFHSKPSSAYHPIPTRRNESFSPAHSLVFEQGELKLHNAVENRSVRIPARWLRDHCSCAGCRNTDTAQRNVNVFKDKLSFELSKVEQNAASHEVIVTFGDGHIAKFPSNFLVDRRSGASVRNRNGIVPIITWTAAIASTPPLVPYSDLDMATLLLKIRTFGFAIVDNMPATPEATEGLLKSIGPIRDTHYGAFYDFTSDLTMKDTAYTSEFLEPHTDNTYFTEPAGLQALHMLSHTQGTGGESSLTDGFNAALKLFVKDRKAYQTLSELRVYAHASGNEGINIQPSHPFPVLSHDPEHGYLTQVRWNNADRAGIATDSFEDVERWYSAAAKFDAILSDPENQHWFQLKPGQTLIFDNWRVLHGRSGFTGKRRMCGGYINRDDFISKFRMCCLGAEEVRGSTVTG